MNNPFSPRDTDRYEIWEMLVARDIKAFVQSDWSQIANDFIEEGFIGIDASGEENPDAWRLTFPNLHAYQSQWTEQAKAFKNTNWTEDLQAALFRNTVMRDIEISGDSALVHKKFFGAIEKADGARVATVWQTLYRCRKVDGSWKIAGFCGFLPHFSSTGQERKSPAKRIPEHAVQHTTAGPYSPVLLVNSGEMVVISGQAAIDMQGRIVGDTIEEQSALTLENCRKQLSAAGCSFDDVFKATIYLKDLADWSRFNKVYETCFYDPKPVRTAVQTGLLSGLLVEIEMWAVRS